MSLFSIARDQEYHSHPHAPPDSPSRLHEEEHEIVLGQHAGDSTKMDSAEEIRKRATGPQHLIDAGGEAVAGGSEGKMSGAEEEKAAKRNRSSGNSRGRVVTRRVIRSTGTKTSITSSSSSSKQNANRPKYGRPGRTKHAAFVELFYGATLYVTCIFLPSFPRYIYSIYVWSNAWLNVIRERMLWSIWITWRFTVIVLEKWGYMDNPFKAGGGQGGAGEEETAPGGGRARRRLGRRIGKYIFSTSTASLWEEFNQHHQGRDGGGGVDSPTGQSTGLSPSPYTWGFGRSPSAFPAILMVLQDIQILVMLAVLLAMIRICFVHMLVPEYLAPRRLEALTRCKSSHLLSSSSYSFGGVRGWEKARERAGVRSRSSGGGNEGGDDVAQPAGWYDRLLMYASYHWYRYDCLLRSSWIWRLYYLTSDRPVSFGLQRLRPSVRRALGHEPSARYNDILTSQHQQQQQPSSPFRRSNSVPSPTQQLFSAPRHATATFRLLYTSISCVSALVLFQSAEFWPRAVLGTHSHASTRHAWDLSGSFSALGFLDDDYDHKNGALKYFFLAQAAYQLHSLCFHVVSMLLLLFYGGGAGGGSKGRGLGTLIDRLRGMRSEKQNQRSLFQQHRQQQSSLVSMKTSMQSYVRPMLEHVIVLALLVGAYLFSGLRRLGAVGIFTLELSSVFLQLLQVCIYAPETSWLRKTEVVLFVHRVLTVPTFVYCRLIVLPFVLWRSALFESQEWLEQIEKVFSPGWGDRIYSMFNGSLCLIFALNLVLFRRLLFHPHLKQIVQQGKDGHR